MSWDASAATLTVTNTSDSGSGSLRDAVASAVPGDAINFNLSTPATITLGSTLVIGVNLTISGPGQSNLAISGDNAIRVLYINPGVTATIAGLTVRNGRDDPSDPYGGGGIFNAGTLILSSSTLSGNAAGTGGGIANYGTLTVSSSTLSGNSAYNGIFGDGGAISNVGPLTVVNSVISGNSANYAGGIINHDVSLTIANSTLSGNSAIYDGGAIVQNFGSVTIIDSTLSGNAASRQGGGIFNYSGALIIKNSTLSSNSAPAGGGLYNYGASTLTNSTLSGNQATAGGAIYNSYSSLTVINSTIAGNSGNSGGGIYNGYVLTLKNTILANNPPGGNCFVTYLLTSAGHNISDDDNCFLTGTGDLNSAPAGLDPGGLQDNGGPTQTIALRVTSPAVDAVSPNYCTLTDGVTPVSADQRGVPRPQVAGCDIGAYELTPFSFSAFTAKLDLKGQGFALNAAFTVGAGGSPIDPSTQAVRLQIGPYIVAIPAGSFHQTQGSNPANWSYAGTINGVKLSVQILARDGRYQFNATGSPVDISGVSNPVDVAIQIGFDAGSTQVTPNI